MKSRSLVIIGLYAVVVAALTSAGWQVLTNLADWVATHINQAQNDEYFRTQNYREFAQWLTPISIVIVLLGGLLTAFAKHKLVWSVIYLALTILPVPLLIITDQIRHGRPSTVDIGLTLAAFAMHLGLCWLLSTAFSRAGKA